MVFTKFKFKIRKFWKINPFTRVKRSEKEYSREKMKKEMRKRIEEERGKK